MKPELALLETPNARHWEKIGIRHHHGFVIPLFCLRSKKSCGIGEYTDLIPLFHWCKEIGYDTIQLLPLNDTGPESSPYSAITAFGLNPLHLGLTELPNIEKYPDLQSQIAELQTMTETQRVDYPALQLKRTQFLRKYFKYEKNIIQSNEYKSFTQENGWLNGYALFKTLKEKHYWNFHENWESKTQQMSEEAIDFVVKQYEPETTYHIFIQFLCFKQFHAVKQLAEQLDIRILGDIPILLSRESTDVWQWHYFFRPEFNAGVPPDMFAKDGQNWGLPIYNWKALEKDDFRWWKNRLKTASLFYDLYRLDHILGFYRIWAIPRKLRGRKGFFIPDAPEEWVQQGETILHTMLECTDMFPIGEDLGFTEESITKSLKRTGIPGIKMFRWERYWHTDKSYIPPETYAPASLTTISTHDTTTLSQWWTEEKESAETLATFLGLKYESLLSVENRLAILRSSHTSGSLFHINLLQEYLALIPELCWPNPDDERINIPGTVASWNWSIRHKPYLEEIITHPKLKQYLMEIITP